MGGGEGARWEPFVRPGSDRWVAQQLR